ncbi:MAG: cbb3-type cytochrome c oxidase subunit 3 [Bdellovibrionota bacterium]
MGDLIRTLSNDGSYPWGAVTALVTFVALFLGVLLYVFSHKESDFERAARLPLEDHLEPKGERP